MKIVFLFTSLLAMAAEGALAGDPSLCNDVVLSLVAGDSTSIKASRLADIAPGAVSLLAKRGIKVSKVSYPYGIRGNYPTPPTGPTSNYVEIRLEYSGQGLNRDVRMDVNYYDPNMKQSYLVYLKTADVGMSPFGVNLTPQIKELFADPHLESCEALVKEIP